MKKLLFANAYFYPLDKKQWKIKQPYPPLGTIQAAALMRENGFEVSLFDNNLRQNASEIIPVLTKEKPDYLIIYDDGFNYLTKMCLTSMREEAFSMLQQGKQQGCTTIVCSSDSTDHYQAYIDHGADFVLLGEGELILKTLIDALEKGEDTSQISGIAFRKNGESPAHKNPKRAVIQDLDMLPMAAWDLVDVAAYRDIWMAQHGYFALNIATTRGCPYKCNWCAKPIYGNRYNSRSPERVADEIEYLIEHHEVNYFWMCDDIFGLKPGWPQKFRDLVKERQLNFKYKIQSRVDLLLKEDTITALADSGLDTVWLGAESGSQKILDAMDKGTKVEQIYQATRLLKKQAVKVAFFIQFGYLGEQAEDIDKTCRMVLDLMPDEIGISVSYPLPGTLFYENVKNDLSKKANWVDSDDLDMMFQNTYPPSYYKRLHRYLHKIYRRKRGYQTLSKLIKKPFQTTFQKLKWVMAVAYYEPSARVDAWRLKKIKQNYSS